MKPTMDMSNSLINKSMKWESYDWARHDWHLKIEAREVASLTCTGILQSTYEGFFGDVPFAISYQEALDSSRISNRANGDDIGIIERISLLSSQFKVKDNGNYRIALKRNEGYCFSDQEGNAIAITRFNYRRSLRLKPEFRLLVESASISPWLIAIVSLYYAIQHAGWP